MRFLMGQAVFRWNIQFICLGLMLVGCGDSEDKPRDDVLGDFSRSCASLRGDLIARKNQIGFQIDKSCLVDSDCAVASDNIRPGSGCFYGCGTAVPVNAVSTWEEALASDPDLNAICDAIEGKDCGTAIPDCTLSVPLCKQFVCNFNVPGAS